MVIGNEWISRNQLDLADKIERRTADEVAKQKIKKVQMKLDRNPGNAGGVERAVEHDGNSDIEEIAPPAEIRRGRRRRRAAENDSEIVEIPPPPKTGDTRKRQQTLAEASDLDGADSPPAKKRSTQCKRIADSMVRSPTLISRKALKLRLTSILAINCELP